MPRVAAICLLVAIFSGCGAENGGDGEVPVVATTPHVADLVSSVGAGRATVDTLVPSEADPHDFEPRPSDARDLAEADLVVRSGGDLDDWLDSLIESAGGDAAKLTLTDAVEERGDDPHWWQDPRNAERAVQAIRDGLVEADPDGRATYERNAARYAGRLRRLDSEIAACLARIPDEQRKLVTTHDSFGYFAERYDVEVVGALIPSLSTQAQPSAGEVDRLVRQIEDENVNAIFPESSLNPELEDAVARETGAEVGRKLWADTLGPEGSPAATYVGAMEENADAIADGMSGGAVRCRFGG